MYQGLLSEESRWKDVQEKPAVIRKRLVTLVLNEFGEYVLPKFEDVIAEDVGSVEINAQLVRLEDRF